MRAIVISEFGGPEVLVEKVVTDPTLKPGDLLVEIKATALNRADILQRKGLYPPPPGVRPDIPGLEFSGIVLESLDSDGLFKAGDRVMGLLPGEGYAEQVTLPSALAVTIPPDLSFEEAAAIPEAYLTAFDALFIQLDIQPDETLLIHAIGSGVGTAALQLAKSNQTVTIGTSSSDEKLEQSRKLGLDCGINYTSNPFAEAIRKTGKNGTVDKILDLVGGTHWENNLDCLKSTGRMLVVGLLGGRKVQADLGILLKKRLTISGTVLRSRSLQEKSALVSQFREKVLPLFETRKIRPVIDRCFHLNEAAKAHRYMEENRNFGKIVLKI